MLQKKSVYVLIPQAHYKGKAILSNCEISFMTTISCTVSLTSISSFYVLHISSTLFLMGQWLKFATVWNNAA